MSHLNNPYGTGSPAPSYRSPNPSEHFQPPDSIPTSPSSQSPYPHQSPFESGSIAPNSRDLQNMDARQVQDDWRQSQLQPEGEYGDIGAHHQRPTSGFGYEDPYDSPYRPSSPSLGPWDSASQQSYNTYSLPPGTTQPLAGDGRSHLRNKPSGGLSYIDEEGDYYQSPHKRPASTALYQDVEMRGLMGNAADMGQGSEEERTKAKFQEFNDSPYPYPDPQSSASSRLNSEPSNLYSMLLFPTGLDRLLALFGVKGGKFPVQQAIERKRRGIGGQKFPIAAWTLTIIMTALMIYELVDNHNITGSVIATKPTFNYMIGPSSEVLINIGARFPPCMKLVDDIPPSFLLSCLNDTSSNPTTGCTVEEICGHGGFHGQDPNQSFRFFTPIFLHVGIIHLILNMIAQITAGAQVEREMGSIPFMIVYFAGGIYGFVLGGNFSRPGVPSVGASGALFATNACVLVDLLLHWKYEERPKLKAFLLAIEFAIGFGIGYIPNAVDGLAHLGGWAMGILFGIILYPSISETNRHRFIVWGLRVVALALIILAFVLTIRNFYTDDPNTACEWCRYLSCIPTSSNNRCKGTGLTQTSSSTRRSWDAL